MNTIGKIVILKEDTLARGTLYNGVKGKVMMETPSSYIIEVNGISFVVSKDSVEDDVSKEDTTATAVDTTETSETPVAPKSQFTPSADPVQSDRAFVWSNHVHNMAMINLKETATFLDYAPGTLFRFEFYKQISSRYKDDGKVGELFVTRKRSFKFGDAVIFDVDGYKEITLKEIVDRAAHNGLLLYCTADMHGKHKSSGSAKNETKKKKGPTAEEKEAQEQRSRVCLRLAW